MDEMNVAMTTVSPMNKAGFFSFGTSVDITSLVLKGKCMRNRALAIIGIAYPDFRDPLMREAEKTRLF